MAAFDIKIGDKVVKVDGPSSAPNDWLTVRDEAYRPNRQQWLLEKWNSENPNNCLDSFDTLSALASRSTIVGEWLSGANAIYAISVGLPRYYEGIIDPKEYENKEAKIRDLSAIAASESASAAAAAADYQNKLKNIRLVAEKSRKEIIGNDKILKVLTLPTNSLPLQMLLAIEKYTPASDSAPTQKAFAREMLINYKLSLLKALKENDQLDVDQLIKGNLK